MERLIFRRGRHADLAGRDLLALLAHRFDDVARLEAQGIELLRVEPDPHCVIAGAEDGDIADAGQARELVDQVDRRVIAHVQAVILPVRRVERHDLQDRGVLFLDRDALGLNGLRQRRQRALNAVLHQHLVGVRIGADIESDRQGIGTVRGAGRLHVKHLVDAIDLGLDRQGDRIDHRLRARPGIAGGDLHGRRHDVRIFGDRQGVEGDPADEHDNDRQHIGEDRMLDEELRDHGAVVLLSVGARQLRDHFHAWRDSPEIADDDKIVGLEAGADHLKTADRLLRRLDITLLDDIVLVDDHEIKAALILADRPRGHEQGAPSHMSLRQPHAHKKPGQKVAVRVSQNAAHLEGAGGGVELRRDVFDMAVIGKAQSRSVTRHRPGP